MISMIFPFQEFMFATSMITSDADDVTEFLDDSIKSAFFEFVMFLLQGWAVLLKRWSYPNRKTIDDPVKISYPFPKKWLSEIQVG